MKKEGFDWRQEKEREKKEEEDWGWVLELTPLHANVQRGVIFLDSSVRMTVRRS